MNKLNKEQLSAVRHKTGPLLIIAGAGTGKTTVITERIKYLIEKKIAKSSEILALTFTEKASREMEERVDIALPYGYTQMWIMTFHSFCERILRQNALHIGLDPRFRLMTSAETTQIIKTNLFKFKLNYFRPLGNPHKFIGGMIQHMSRLQDENITPDDYLKWAKKQKDEKYLELAHAYKTYEELKIGNGVMDFGDLIVKTIKLFKERPNILKEYQAQFKHILIDEFQDTNYSQNQLVLILSKKHKNITVVGDDDQSIYRFRGAAVSNIIQFRKNFSKARIVVLTKNYRSTQEILDKSYTLIQNNNPDRLEVIEKVDKKLTSERKIKGTEIGFIHVDRVENEAEAIAEKITELIKKEKRTPGDFAILVRANNHAEPITRALSRNGIPYQFLGPGRLFKQSEIIDLIAYLKVLTNFEDSVAFHRILSLDTFDVNVRDIAAIGNYSKKNNISYFESAERVEKISVSDESKEKIKKIVEIIHKHLGLVRKESAGQILYYFLQDSGLLANLLDPKSDEVSKRASNISKFFDKLKSYEVDHPEATVFTVVDWIDLSMELGESPLANDTDWGSTDAVNILTVHSSKGLEFPVVFLVNLTTGRFPTIERREQIPIPDDLIQEILPEGDYHMEEERRLFYVGMTRAKDRLFLTVANYYGEGKREKKISNFIFETLGEEALTNELKSKEKQLSFLDYSKKEEKRKTKLDKFHVDYISYSQIETFKVCPLHYKLRYILKVPTPPSAAQSFGISVHNALRDFYSSIQAGEKGTEKLLLNSLKNNWISEGFLTKAHEKKFLEQAKKYLSDFFKKEYDKNKIPVLLEQSFTIPIERERLLKIGGKMDRVDELPDGSIEIIDYKTGANVPTQKEVDHDKQLTFYALAATTMKEFPFNKKAEQVKLTLYYFDGQKKISTVRTKSDLVKAKQEILKIRDEIENSDFQCSQGMLCKNCEYKLICNTD
ncbi:MAG TPA: ATP-dependent DNA helicase [Candidatus Saccharimonadales bacterium]|nr:ATP-dependent DNA helicase [Candidatus Saccharimonadales bacterium]